MDFTPNIVCRYIILSLRELIMLYFSIVRIEEEPYYVDLKCLVLFRINSKITDTYKQMVGGTP